MSNHSNEPWSDADLFFLSDTLRHGMSVAEVAGFLGRSVDEVLAKAKALHIALRSSLKATQQRASFRTVGN
jgi:hypothetical protein